MLKVGRGGALPPFMVMDVITAANARQAAIGAGRGVIRMEVGQPGTGAPAGAAAAAMASLGRGEPMGYTEAMGRASLRARIARHYGEWYRAEIDPARVVVTMGASGAFPLAFLAAFDPGDVVAMASPFYPPYVNILTSLGMVPAMIETGPETRFQPTVAALERLHPRPQGLIVASPCNPAGTMLHADELAAIGAWCAAEGVRLISDEIYHGLHYDAPIATAAGIPGAVVVNSFSKYFSMTGWRIGWMVLPDDLLRPVECLAQNHMISASHIAQIAAEAAFGCTPELEANVARYRASRDTLLTALPRAGMKLATASEGAFYLWADVSGRSNDSREFCARLLAELDIAASPGVDFDRARGSRFVRFSYCGTEAEMAEAAARIAAWG